MQAQPLQLPQGIPQTPMGSQMPTSAMDAPQGQSQIPWAQILANPGQPHNNTPDNLAALRNDPQGDHNKAYMPGVENSANPFSNGNFKTTGERIQREQEVLSPSPDQPIFGMTGVQHGMGQAVSNPLAPPIQQPLSGQMPNLQEPNPFAMMNSGGFTGPKTPQNDAAALAEYGRQAKPGGLRQYRRPI